MFFSIIDYVNFESFKMGIFLQFERKEDIYFSLILSDARLIQLLKLFLRKTDFIVFFRSLFNYSMHNKSIVGRFPNG